jgi:hypothetical protein
LSNWPLLKAPSPGPFLAPADIFAWQFGTFRLILHVVDDLVSDIVGDPNAF